MIAPFSLDDTGYHADTKRHYTGRVAELVKLDTPLGESYRRNFLGLPQIATPEPKSLLRSLPEAKQCRHLGPVLKEKEGCGTCTTYQCAKRGETKMTYCTGECGQWERRNDTIATVSLGSRVIRFDQRNLAPHTGGVRLNPSIIQSGSGYIFAYRNKWGNSDISLIRLNAAFEPVGEPKQLNLSYPGATSKGREDLRLFRHKGQLHGWYIGWNGRRGKGQYKANVLFARINEQTLEVEDKFFPRIPGRNPWEKNHAMFDLNNETYSIYSIAPHRVHKVYCETVQQTWETRTNVKWRYGYLRGGASPVLHNGRFYAFFHGMDDSGPHRLYTLGVYCFDAEPPFRITHITHEPLEIAGPRKGSARVIFPGGAMFIDGQWCIACGIHDEYSELRFYSEQQVESALEPI